MMQVVAEIYEEDVGKVRVGQPAKIRVPSSFRPGYEAAREIVALGPDVKGFKVGEAVSVVPSFSLNEYGLYCDLANIPAAALARHPASLSWVEAAALWMQYLTAYGALIELAKLKAGDAVLIPAASSSIGLAAIQIARSRGPSRSTR